MKKNIISFSILILSTLQILHAQNAPVTTIGTVSSSSTSITVPVTVTNFTNIGSCNLKIVYDPAIVLATSVTVGPGVGGNLSANISTPGVITLGWYTYPGITLSNNTILFNINFQKVNAGTSALTCSDDGYSCIYYDGNWNPLIDTPYANFYQNGSVTFMSTNAPITTAPSFFTYPGTIVSVPITVTSFNNIGSVSLTLNYNPAVLNYISGTNTSGFPGLTISSTTPGTIIIGGSSSVPVGVTFSNNTTLLTLNFNYLGGTTNLNWSDNGVSCQYTGPLNSPILNDIPQSTYYINGSISQDPFYVAGLFLVTQDIGTTLFLSWPPVAGAGSYNIFYRPLLSPPSGAWVGNSVTYPYIKAINLTPGTTYECKYVAYTSSGIQIAGGTASGIFIPSHVSFAKSMDIGTTCQIDWDDFSSWVSSYVFQYRIGTGSWLPSVRYSPNGKAVNMTPGAPYECRAVVYRNGSLWGTTESWNFTPQPVVFTLGTHTSTTCYISWTSMTPWATDRHFYYKKTTDINWIGMPAYQIDQVHLTGITPDVQYQCKVWAYIPTFWGETATGTFTLPSIAKELSSNDGNNKISIYPNPFMDQVNLNFFAYKETKVIWNIYNMTGKVVLNGSNSVSTGYNTLNIDAVVLTKGVYMLNAMINDHMLSFRIIK